MGREEQGNLYFRDEGASTGPFLFYMNRTIIPRLDPKIKKPINNGMDMVFPFCFNSSALLTVAFDNRLKSLQSMSDCITKDEPCVGKFHMDVGVERRMELPGGWDQHDYTKKLHAPDEGGSWGDYLSYSNTYQRIAADPKAKAQNLSITVGGKASKVALEMIGHGAIKAIILKVPISSWDDLAWQMTWDDATDPQVQAPFNRMYNSWTVGDKPLLGYQIGAFQV